MKNRKKYKSFAGILLGMLFLILLFSVHEETKRISKNADNNRLIINEIQYSNLGTYLDCDGDASDWIEIFNNTAEDIDLSKYTLSDSNEEKAKWKFPNNVVIKSGEYIIVWASGKDMISTDGEIHTNFLINSKDTIILASETGEIIDEVCIDENVPVGISVGRTIKDAQKYGALSASTPGRPNNAAIISLVSTTTSEIENAQFSMESGIYDEEFYLSLSTIDDTLTILYTLDGSEPTKDSYVYYEPIKIHNINEIGSLASIKTTTQYKFDYVWESTYNEQGMVVRARTMKDGILSEEIVSKSYYINPQTTLPIVSLILDPNELFNENSGLYVPGNTYYIWKKYNKGNNWKVYPPANYFNDNKVDATISYIEDDVFFESKASISIFGSGSRSNPSKSLKVSVLSNDGINYSIYNLSKSQNVIDDNNKQSQIVLRNSGIDFNSSMFRDLLAHRLVAEQTNNTALAGSPVTLYINGEYWGINNIRECYNAEYFSNHYGIDEKDLVILDLSRSDTSSMDEVKYGTEADLLEYYDLISFCNNNDLSDDDYYEYVCSQVDIDNLIDYYVAEIYFGNNDWPGNNYRVWRSRQSTNSCDTKWRFLFFDLDNAIKFKKFNSIEYIFSEEVDKSTLVKESNGWVCDGNNTMIQALIKNDTFRNKFIDRFNNLLDTTFNSENVINEIDNMYQIYEPEMDLHYKRWHTKNGWLSTVVAFLKKDNYYNNAYNYDRWIKEIELMKNFAEERPAILSDYLDKYCEKNGY